MTTIVAPVPTAGVRRRVTPRRDSLRALRLAVSGILLALAAVTAVVTSVFVVVNHIGFAPVLSPSMQPTFDPGDLVVTRPQATSTLRVGQVVMLPVPGSSGQRYVHRIIRVEHEAGRTVVRTKGDNNTAPEDYRLQVTSATVPVVVSVVPGLGRASLQLTGGPLRAVVIGLIGLTALVGVKRLVWDR